MKKFFIYLAFLTEFDNAKSQNMKVVEVKIARGVTLLL